MATTVGIVEDNAGICEELRHVIARAPDLECVCICRNAIAALDEMPRHAPEVILMDIHLPDGSGIECVAQLRARLPQTQILMYTVYDDNEQIFKALRAGAVGYLLKTSESEEIVAAIREAKRGGAPLTGDVARKVIESFHKFAATTGAVERLTEREREVLHLVAHGLLDKQIADRLAISLQTVNSHLKNIYGKLEVHSRTEAAFKYLA